jgi:hypothetical protein
LDTMKDRFNNRYIYVFPSNHGRLLHSSLESIDLLKPVRVEKKYTNQISEILTLVV